jgi:hypothetical protein
MEKKFNEIIESYLNGNISWVKERVKKLSRENRKKLYLHFLTSFPDRSDSYFFFMMI